MAFTTRGSLLSAVRRGNEVGWDEFYNTYKPLILLRGGDLRPNQTEKEELNYMNKDFDTDTPSMLFPIFHRSLCRDVENPLDPENGAFLC